MLMVRTIYGDSEYSSGSSLRRVTNLANRHGFVLLSRDDRSPGIGQIEILDPTLPKRVYRALIDEVPEG